MVGLPILLMYMLQEEWIMFLMVLEMVCVEMAAITLEQSYNKISQQCCLDLDQNERDI